MATANEGAASAAPSVLIFDNGGRTFDRYTVVFPDHDALLIGPTGNHPQGVCMWASDPWQPEGEEVSFELLPLAVQSAIREAWVDFYA